MVSSLRHSHWMIFIKRGQIEPQRVGQAVWITGRQIFWVVSEDLIIIRGAHQSQNARAARAAKPSSMMPPPSCPLARATIPSTAGAATCQIDTIHMNIKYSYSVHKAFFTRLADKHHPHQHVIPISFFMH